MFTLPKSANHFSINTNSRDLDYQVSTKQILQIIKSNPQGLTLTEIAKQVDPNWQASNCKRMFKQAIDPLCLRDQVRFTVSPSGKRVKYFPTKVSKRWLVRELYNQMINAWSFDSGMIIRLRKGVRITVSPESNRQIVKHIWFITLYHLSLDSLSTPLLDSV